MKFFFYGGGGGRCECRREVFVKIHFFFLGGGGQVWGDQRGCEQRIIIHSGEGGGRGCSGWGGGQGGCERRIETL